MQREKEKKNSFLDSKYNRYAVIAIELAGLLTLVIVTCSVLKGDIFSTFSPETTKYILQNQLTDSDSNNSTSRDHLFNQSGDNTEQKSDDDLNSLLNDYGNGNLGSEQGNSGAQPKPLPNPSGWTKAQIISKAKEAVNKTQSYKKNVTVHHKETFEATVTECTGGSIVQTIANTMVGWIVKPVDESLSFKNGRANNSEGENIPLILPKKGSFNLSASGVSAATAKLSGNEYVIKLNLISESVGIGEVPTHNASSIGYLDVTSLDISFMEIDRADITYSGSSIELHINSEGYITYAVYKVPLDVSGAAHRGSISGSAEFTGEQSEIWTINY